MYCISIIIALQVNSYFMLYMLLLFHTQHQFISHCCFLKHWWAVIYFFDFSVSQSIVLRKSFHTFRYRDKLQVFICSKERYFQSRWQESKVNFVLRIAYNMHLNCEHDSRTVRFFIFSVLSFCHTILDCPCAEATMKVHDIQSSAWYEHSTQQIGFLGIWMKLFSTVVSEFRYSDCC